MEHDKCERVRIPNRLERTFSLKEALVWSRILAAGLGSLGAYLLWRLLYGSQLNLPYPVEIPLFLEALWGVLVGLGPFLGLAILQTGYSLASQSREGQEQNARLTQRSLAKPVRDQWSRSILSALGGLAGGIIWWFAAAMLPLDSSGLPMTGLWSIVYTGAILLPPLAARRNPRTRLSIILPLALLPIAGFLLTKWLHIAPDQADLDMSVGLWLRVSIVAGAILSAPPATYGKPARNHASGKPINLLLQTMMQQKHWLTKGGVLLLLAEELSYSPAMIRKLCSGERRPSPEATRKLLQLGQGAGLDRAWGLILLETSEHFSDLQIANELERVF